MFLFMEKLPKRYISVDIEASGQYPWNSSMISLGACVVDGNFDKTFYAELKPITKQYILDNFKKGASKLNCLKNYNFSKFNPEEVLDILYEKGEKPSEAIPKFAKWILGNTKGHKPFLASDNNLFDGMFLFYYLSNFYKNKNPFGYSGENMSSVFRGASRNMGEDIKNLIITPRENPGHHALEDAISQGIKFYDSLKHLGHKF